MRPFYHCQEYIKDEQCDRDVVEQRCLAQRWPELVGGPKKKRGRQKNGFDNFRPCRPPYHLVNKTGTGDQSKRDCGQEIVRPSWKEPGKNVP